MLRFGSAADVEQNPGKEYFQMIRGGQLVKMRNSTSVAFDAGVACQFLSP